MYTFSSKLKTFSFVLMAIGLLGIGYGFLTAPKDIQEVEKILAADAHGSHHEASSESEGAHAVSSEAKVKAEAERRNIFLKELFEEMWTLYEEQRSKKR